MALNKRLIHHYHPTCNLTVTGSGTTIDYSSILKFDNTIGKYDMTPVEFDRDNNNPDFTRSNLFFDNTSENFDMT